MKTPATLIAFIAAALLCPVSRAADTSADEQTLRKIHKEWEQAYMKRDQNFAEKMVADDYVFIGPDGDRCGKAQYVKDMAGDTVFSSFETEKLDYRFYGDTAVVVGVANIKAKEKEQDLSGRYAFTDVYVKKEGAWKCVSTQVTPLAEQK